MWIVVLFGACGGQLISAAALIISSSITIADPITACVIVVNLYTHCCCFHFVVHSDILMSPPGVFLCLFWGEFNLALMRG